MSDLDEQRRKRPGNRDRINQIKDKMDQDVLRDKPYQPDTQQHTKYVQLCKDGLRDRIAAAIRQAHSELNFSLVDTWDGKCVRLADAVIRELDGTASQITTKQ